MIINKQLIFTPLMGFTLFVFVWLCNSAVWADTPLGNLDPTFNAGWGFVATDFENYSSDTPTDMTLQPDGKIVVVGEIDGGVGDINFGVARYLANGTLDPTFGGMDGLGTGRVVTNFDVDLAHASTVLMKADGKILVVGSAGDSDGSNYQWALAQFNPDGSADNNFGVQGQVSIEIPVSYDDEPSVFESQAFIVGNKLFAIFNINSGQIMTRFNMNDGSLDETFGVGGHKQLNLPLKVHDVATHGDSIILAGSNNKGHGQIEMTYARIDKEGNLDNTFGDNGIATINPNWSRGIAYSVVVQSDGAIYGAGLIRTATYGEDKMVVISLLSDGTVDSSFGVAGVYQGSSGILSKITLAPGGVVVAVGSEGSGNNTTIAVVRLGFNGAPDENFGADGLVSIDIGGGFKDATEVLTYENGNILVSGGAKSGDYDFGLARVIVSSSIRTEDLIISQF